MLFNVKWEIDVDAESPREAAEMAKDIQLDRIEWGNTATIFDVTDESGKVVRVDLLEGEDEFPHTRKQFDTPSQD